MFLMEDSTSGLCHTPGTRAGLTPLVGSNPTSSALSPRFFPRAGVLLCDAHLPAETSRKTVLPITLTGSMSLSPLHPQIGEHANQKHPFQVQFLGTLAGGGRALRSSAATAIRSTPARGRNCVSLVLKSRQLPGAPHIYSESEAITDFVFPHGCHPRIGLAT